MCHRDTFDHICDFYRLWLYGSQTVDTFGAISSQCSRVLLKTVSLSWNQCDSKVQSVCQPLMLYKRCDRSWWQRRFEVSAMCCVGKFSRNQKVQLLPPLPNLTNKQTNKPKLSHYVSAVYKNKACFHFRSVFLSTLCRCWMTMDRSIHRPNEWTNVWMSTLNEMIFEILNAFSFNCIVVFFLSQPKIFGACAEIYAPR